MRFPALTAATLATFGAALTAANENPPARPTFYKEVLPIFQANCQECHRPAGTNYGGMVAPFSLMTFEEARPWAKSIAAKVQAREMPPWHADQKHRGVFKNERSLTDAQIATLVSWTESGAKSGNPADAPAPREFAASGGWMIGEPDLIVAMPAPYFVGDDVNDQYTAFEVDLTDTQLPNDVWITSFQCKPGSKIIHHFNCHLLAPGADGKLTPHRDAPESDAISPVGAGIYIGGVSSGTDANLFPADFGVPLKRGSRVTFDIHYHKEPGAGTAVTDVSHIGFKLTSTPPKRQLGGVKPLMNFDINIPPYEKRLQIGPIKQTIKDDVDIISFMPHMHMRGTEALFELFYPDGTSEVGLHVPQYDFSWQTVYYLKEMKRIPAGTRIEYTAWYDNSKEMAEKRGFDPAQEVHYGESSTDEMTMGFIMAAVAKD